MPDTQLNIYEPMTYDLLYIRPLKATLTVLDGSMKTFVTFTAGDKKVKSSKCYFSGKEPTWEDLLTLDIKGHHSIKVDLKYHHLLSSNEIAASGELQIATVIAMKGKYHNSLPLYNGGKVIGEVELKCSFRDPTKYQKPEKKATPQIKYESSQSRQVSDYERYINREDNAYPNSRGEYVIPKKKKKNYITGSKEGDVKLIGFGLEVGFTILGALLK